MMALKQSMGFSSRRSELSRAQIDIVFPLPEAAADFAGKAESYLKVTITTQVNAYASFKSEVELNRQQALTLADAIIKEMK